MINEERIIDAMMYLKKIQNNGFQTYHWLNQIEKTNQKYFLMVVESLWHRRINNEAIWI